MVYIVIYHVLSVGKGYMVSEHIVSGPLKRVCNNRWTC
jgi:hypothetical protein